MKNIISSVSIGEIKKAYENNLFVVTCYEIYRPHYSRNYGYYLMKLYQTDGYYLSGLYPMNFKKLIYNEKYKLLSGSDVNNLLGFKLIDEN